MSAVARFLRAPSRPSPPMVMAAGVVVAFVVILVVGRHLSTFLFDEWNIFINRGGWDPDTLLRPHNEHLSALPVAIFKVFFETVGAAPYWPYRVAVALVVVGLGVLVYLFAVPRLGTWWALVPGLLTVLVGPGGQDIVWPFQLGFDCSLAAGIGMLLCLDRGTRRAEWWASVLILIALSSSSIGLAVLAAAAVNVALGPDPRERALRILALPVTAYALWYAVYHEAEFMRENLVKAPAYVLDSAGGAAGALVGLPGTYYPAIALAFVVLVAWGLLRQPSRTDLQTYLTVLAMPVVFWLLTAIGRGDQGQPTTSRYLLPGAIFVALLACQALAGLRPPPRAAWLAAALVVFASWTHVAALRDETRGEYVGGFTSHVRAELAALSLAREAGTVADDFKPDAVRAPDIVAGPYFAAVADYGEPVPDPVSALADSFEGPRASADTVYFTALGAGVRPSLPPAAGAAGPVVLEGQPARSGGCAVVGAGRTAVFALAPGGLTLRTAGRAPADVKLRRWATAYVATNGLNPNTWGTVALGRDRDPKPVQVQVSARRDVRVCGPARPG